MQYLSEIKEIGKKTEGLLEKLGIRTIEDLIRHFPRRYEQFLAPVRPGEVKEGKNAVIGTVLSKFVSGSNGLISLYITDGTGSLPLRWFHNPYIRNILKYGETYVFCGNVSWFHGKPSMAQPVFYTYEEYRCLSGSIMPVYALTKGLSNDKMFQFILEALTNMSEPMDPLPEKIKEKYHLISKGDAIRCIHYPASWEVLNRARHRIIFDEFYTLLYKVRYRSISRGENSFHFTSDQCVKSALDKLEYPLTDDQKNIVSEIQRDMTGFLVANRLVQGDVGCGKTIVALLSMIFSAENGYQAVLMAPTEVLASQHFHETEKVITKIGKMDEFNPVLLTGSMKEKEKKAVREQIATGKSRIIIGTHALIQDAVSYDNLSLVIIDEQHRFGVEQREAFSSKSDKSIHTVIMTATPIPRTTGKILFGGMDVCTIKEKPAKRIPVKSCSIRQDKKNTVYRLMLDEIVKGRQAYVICPMVEEDNDGGKKSVEGHRKALSKIFPGVEIGVLHGKMSAEKKQKEMDRFANNETKILVSTTVVEVGVNVPNATVMVVEDADMFGMLQLHQLRGRVGRGEHQSYCAFISSKPGIPEKLDILSRTNDGFEIAEADYRLRKGGDLVGTKQSGDMGFRMADLIRDEWILKEAMEAVEECFPAKPI